MTTLFKKTTNGKVQQWSIELDQDRYRTIEGLKDGKMTTSKWKYAEPTNMGKKNERNRRQQAVFEYEAKIKYMLDRGYVENLKDVNKAADLFKPMLAEKYSDKKKLVTFPLHVQPKLDGMRCIIKSDGMFSREGKPIVSSPHIFNRLVEVGLFESFPNLILDGELYNHAYKADFNKIISLTRKTKPTEADLKESEQIIEFHCFDCFNKDFDEDPFSMRIELARNILLHMDMFVAVETLKVPNQKVLDKIYDRYLRQGYEGQMIRLNDSEYQQKRTNNLLKRKEFIDQEYLIVDIEEGVGNRSNMMGRFVLKLGAHTFGASARGNIELFKEYWNNKQSYIGKMATVRYQNLTPDGIPRFPVVVAIRDYE